MSTNILSQVIARLEKAASKPDSKRTNPLSPLELQKKLRNDARRRATPLSPSKTPLEPELKKRVDELIVQLLSKDYFTSGRAEKALLKYVQENFKGGDKIRLIPEMWRLLGKFGYQDPLEL